MTNNPDAYSFAASSPATKQTFKFGDIVENGWASERNPTRFGIFVRRCKSQGMNCIEMTDGKGKFWRVIDDKESKHTKHGSVLRGDMLPSIDKACATAPSTVNRPTAEAEAL